MHIPAPTTPDTLAIIRKLTATTPAPQLAYHLGWDVHRLAVGRPLILGGVIGAQYGVGYAERLRAEQLRAGLALLVLAVAVRMALGLVVPPSDMYAIEAPGVE